MRAKKLSAVILISSILLSMGPGCSKKSKTDSGIATIKGNGSGDAVYELVSSKNSRSKSKDEELKKAYSEFVVGMVNRCAEGSGDENFLVSTDSVLFALEMTAAGADGETLDQMLSTLMPGVDKEDALLFAVDRMDQIKSSQLKIANSVWLNDDVKGAFYSDYLTYVEKNFDAKIAAIPFDKSGVKRVNSWVEDNTNGMIPELIDELSTDDVMVLINALAFDAKWKKTFEEKDIKDLNFRRADGSSERCRFLCGSDDVTFLHNENAYGFYKPYEGGKYAFMVMLPGKTKDDFGIYDSLDDLLSGNTTSKHSDGDDGITYDINSFVSRMTAEDYWAFWNSSNSDDVDYKFPEFTSEYSTSLSGILQDMGMEDAFDPSAADFGNMSDLKPLSISDVIHSTKIEVNATGTRASASTGVIMEHNSVVMKREVICDRPFAYAIVDLETGLPLFFGTVTHVN